MELCLKTLFILTISVISSSFGYSIKALITTENQNYTAGLFWDHKNRVLFYVDRAYLQIHSLDITSDKDYSINIGKMPSFIIPTKDTDYRYIIGEDTSLVYLNWPYDHGDGYFAECLITTVDYCCKGNNLNDARADADGRIWVGTYDIPSLNGTYEKNKGSLYRIDTRTKGKAEVATVIRPVTFGNDLTWTRDNTKFYFTESDAGCIYSFNYDLENGVICCGETVFCFSDHNITGKPDGLTIDWNDDLWIAAYGAGMILNVNPNTKLLMRTVLLPIKTPIDLEFGGPELDKLYCSSRNVGDPTDPTAGAIFEVTGLDVYGVPEHYAVMNSDCTPEFSSDVSHLF